MISWMSNVIFQAPESERAPPYCTRLDYKSALLPDAPVGCVYAPEISAQILVIAGMVQKALAGHVAVLEAGSGERRGESVDRVVVVVLLGVQVLVLVERVAPLERAPQRQVGLLVHQDGDGFVLG